MIPTVGNLIGIIEKYAPLTGAEPWDNSGLQVGDLKSPAHTVAVSLDADSLTIARAVEKNASLLITHHPLIFPSICSVDLSIGTGRAIAAAIEGGLSVYSSHTSLDHSFSGTSLVLAQAIGLEEITPLPFFKSGHPVDRRSNAQDNLSDGIIIFGKTPIPVSFTELAVRAKKALAAPMLRITGNESGAISRVAVCAGSGGDFLRTAVSGGAEVFITGEIKYHTAQAALDLGLNVIETGHYWSELPIVEETARTILEAAQLRNWDISVVTIDGRDPFIFR
jgi:dinuclear metal center YbgI/SA1388 family protein